MSFYKYKNIYISAVESVMVSVYVELRNLNFYTLLCICLMSNFVCFDSFPVSVFEQNYKFRILITPLKMKV